MLWIHCVGDSLTEGYPVTLNTLSWPAKLNMLLGPSWRVKNNGIRAYTISLLEGVAQSAVAADCVADDGVQLVIAQGGTNNLIAAQTPAQVKAEMDAFVANRLAQGQVVFAVTVPPAIGGLFNETDRQSYNTLLRADKAGAHRLIDWAADSRLSDPTDATYFYSGDQTHFTEAGNDVCAELALAQITAHYGTIVPRGFKLA